MNPVLAYSSDAEALGARFGMVLCVAILVFSIIAVVKAFTQRTTGWIITGCIGGLILAIPVAAGLLGAVSGLLTVKRLNDQRARTQGTTQSSAPTAVITASASSRPKTDATLLLRTEARKMAELLIACDVAPDEAYHIALRKMPRAKTIQWWETEFLPRFNQEQGSMLKAQMQRYLNASNAATEAVIDIEFAELVIIAVLQQESGLSSTDGFRVWQAGLAFQPDEWWSLQMTGLTQAKQKQLRDLRAKISGQ